MSLHNGIDTISIVSRGVWSKTYTSAQLATRLNLYVSFGLSETLPAFILRRILRGLSRLGLGNQLR